MLRVLLVPLCRSRHGIPSTPRMRPSNPFFRNLGRTLDQFRLVVIVNYISQNTTATTYNPAISPNPPQSIHRTHHDPVRTSTSMAMAIIRIAFPVHRWGWGQLILFGPVPDLLEIPALVMGRKIRSHTLRGCRICHDEIRSCIAVAHQRDSQSFNTVVYVHATANRVGAQITGSFDNIFVAKVPIAPGVLTDEVLRQN